MKNTGVARSQAADKLMKRGFKGFRIVFRNNRRSRGECYFRPVDSIEFGIVVAIRNGAINLIEDLFAPSSVEFD